MSGGTENDSISDNGANIGSMLFFGGDGADQIIIIGSTSNQTIVGGNDSADGADVIQPGTGNDGIFGNGGGDTITDVRGGSDTFAPGRPRRLGGVGVHRFIRDPNRPAYLPQFTAGTGAGSDEVARSCQAVSGAHG